ncbi:hypothetical protein M405DRAFT_25570 [Rhizopogon salebrosus TDB-379]|nr:hypothetical protein M405DRAFT_25570 [Rhizopogon salebrosus TDB-379]
MYRCTAPPHGPQPSCYSTTACGAVVDGVVYCSPLTVGAGQRGLLERSDLSLTHEVQWQDEIMTKLRQRALYSGGYDLGTPLGPQTPLLHCIRQLTRK